MGKVQFPFSRSLVLLFYTFLFWKEDWELSYNSIKFRDFPDISEFPKIPDLA